MTTLGSGYSASSTLYSQGDESDLRPTSPTVIKITNSSSRLYALTLVSQSRGALLELEGGSLRARMEEARGHCHKIANIFKKYLNPWFDRLVADSFLESSEAESLRGLFELLSVHDMNMITQIGSIVDWLTPAAESTLDLVEEGKLEAADAKVRSARKEAQACTSPKFVVPEVAEVFGLEVQAPRRFPSLK